MIDHGKLVVYDTIENVTAKFSGNGGVELVEVGLSRPVDDDVLAKNVPSLSGVISVEKVDTMHLNIKFSGGDGSQERLLADLVGMKIGVISFKASSSALEDTYMKLIKDTV
jgi:ABC-type multidrug transport system ATPase subunit